MKRARLVAPARHEFLAGIAYYDGKESGLGRRFVAAVEEATTRALAFPLAGSLGPHDTRRVFMRDFPFAIEYRPDEGGIVIFAIAHHARHPAYWQSRVQDR